MSGNSGIWWFAGFSGSGSKKVGFFGSGCGSGRNPTHPYFQLGMSRVVIFSGSSGIGFSIFRAVSGRVSAANFSGFSGFIVGSKLYLFEIFRVSKLRIELQFFEQNFDNMENEPSNFFFSFIGRFYNFRLKKSWFSKDFSSFGFFGFWF